MLQVHCLTKAVLQMHLSGAFIVTT